MAKQDVLDAINATIVPNGTKAINADSLRNLLTMMVENAGEGGGSGDGALRVIVPEHMMLGVEFVDLGEFSPTSWEEMKSIYEQTFGVDLSEYDAAVKASFEHNANVAQQIIEKAKSGQGVSVVLDQTPYSQACSSIQLQMASPEESSMVESLAMSIVQPAGLALQYMKYTPEGESMIGVGEIFACMLAPVGMINSADMGTVCYPPHIIITLNLDGSLLFTPTETDTESGS